MATSKHEIEEGQPETAKEEDVDVNAECSEEEAADLVCRKYHQVGSARVKMSSCQCFNKVSTLCNVCMRLY